MATNNIPWPNLNEIKFISGRTATEADVENGNAVFVLKSNNSYIGRSIPITIPQYAYHIDQESGEKSPCILIQAEEANGQEIAACVLVGDGSAMAGLLNEFQLLGVKIK